MTNWNERLRSEADEAVRIVAEQRAKERQIAEELARKTREENSRRYEAKQHARRELPKIADQLKIRDLQYEIKHEWGCGETIDYEIESKEPWTYGIDRSVKYPFKIWDKGTDGYRREIIEFGTYTYMGDTHRDNGRGTGKYEWVPGTAGEWKEYDFRFRIQFYNYIDNNISILLKNDYANDGNPLRNPQSFWITKDNIIEVREEIFEISYQSVKHQREKTMLPRQYEDECKKRGW